jgi:hypothetical protein
VSLSSNNDPIYGQGDPEGVQVRFILQCVACGLKKVCVVRVLCALCGDLLVPTI